MEPLLGPGSPHSPPSASRCQVLVDTGATERNHSWVLAVLLQLPVVTSWSGHRSNGTEPFLGPGSPHSPPSASVVTSWSGHRSNGTEPLLGPGSPHFPPSASRCQVLADTGATERNHSWVLAVLLQLPVVTSWSGHRSNGTESLLGPGSPHSPPSASRCHVFERTQEQRNGTTPGSWQSSLSSSSFPLSRLGADTGATERNHSWVLAVLTLLLQLPVVTSWSGHRSNRTEPLLGPGSPHSPPSASRCHVLERTQEQRNGTTPGSWQSSLSSFSFPLSRLGADAGATERNHSWVLAVLTLLIQLPVVTSWSGHRSNGRNHSWVLAVFTLLLQLPVVTSWSGHRSNGTEPLLVLAVLTLLLQLPVVRSWWTQEQRNGTTPGSWQSSFSFPLSRLGADTGATERNHSWVLAVLTLLLQLPLSRLGADTGATERNHSWVLAVLTFLLQLPVVRSWRTQEQRNGTTPGSWQSSFSFPLSRLGADTGATERNHSWVLAVLTLLLQLPVVTSLSGHRSNGTEPLLGPGSPHSPPPASRCHVLERTQEQRNGTTPGSWQSSLSSFSFPLSRLGVDTGATERNHSWVLAVLTLLLQLPVVTSWSGHRSNGTEPLLGPGSHHSPPSASRCHVLERTQEQRNGTTPGSWQSSLSSFSFPLSRLGADTGATERNHSWVLAVFTLLLQLPVVTSWSGHRSNGTEPLLVLAVLTLLLQLPVVRSWWTQEQRNGTTPGSWQSSFSFPLSRLGADTGATERNHSWVLAVLTLLLQLPLSRLGADTGATERNHSWVLAVLTFLLQLPVVRSWRTQEQRNGTTPGSWQSSFSFPLSRLGADTGATERNHSWVLAVLTLLLQLPVVTSLSGHRSNGTEPLLGPGSPHSPPPASRCHVLERTQEQRNGTTPGSWQSSLSSFSFPLSRLGVDTGATERNHSWVLAVLTLLLQLPVVTSWSGHRSNGTEPLLGPGSHHSPPSASRCHVLERTQEQRNGTTPGSWQSSLSSFSFPLSRLGADTEATERNHSWVLAVFTLLLQLPVVTSWSGHRSNGTEPLLVLAVLTLLLQLPVVRSWWTQEQRNGTTPGSWQSSFSFPLSRLGADTGATERNHSWVLAVLTLLLQLPLSRLGADTGATERNHSWVLAVLTFLLQLPVVRSWRTQEQRNGTTPGSWQSSFSFPLSRLGADTGATERNHSWVLAVLTLLLQLPVVTSLSGHRSNGTEPLLGPGSPHSPPPASRCHVLERTQEQRNGTTPGSWQSSLSSFSFPLSRLGVDTGATERNHSWVLAVLTLLLQLPVVTSWSGHRSNGTEPLLGPGSHHSPPSASRCHVLERTQEQRNGTTPGSWQSSLSSFSFPLSRLGADTGTTERNHSWVLAVFTLLLQLPVVTSWSGHRSNGTEPLLVLAVLTLLLQLPVITSWSGHRSNGTEPLLGPGSLHSPPSASRCHVLERTQEQRNGTTPGSWQSSLSSFSFPLSLHRYLQYTRCNNMSSTSGWRAVAEDGKDVMRPESTVLEVLAYSG